MSKQTKMPKEINLKSFTGITKVSVDSWEDVDIRRASWQITIPGSLPNLRKLHAWLGKVIAAKEGKSK